MVTSAGARVQGLPNDPQEKHETIFRAWIHLLFEYPVLRVYVAEAKGDGYKPGSDVFEYESPGSVEEIEKDAEETMVVHREWGTVEPFEWLCQAHYTPEPRGRGQLHVFDSESTDGLWIL